MRAVSVKRARQLREYRKLRDAFLELYPHCQWPEGCYRFADVVHHRRGRRGVRLLDTDWWAASCDHHNDYAETETGICLANGWLVRIEGAA